MYAQLVGALAVKVVAPSAALAAVRRSQPKQPRRCTADNFLPKTAMEATGVGVASAAAGVVLLGGLEGVPTRGESLTVTAPPEGAAK